MNKALVKREGAFKSLKKIFDIEFLHDTKTHRNRMEIPSETSNNLYIVSQTKRSGIWQCACLGFRRHRICKHLKAIVPVIEATVERKAIK